MSRKSRREFFRQTVLLAGATVAPKLVQPVLGAAMPALAPQGEAPAAYESRSSAASPYVPVRILDTEKMPRQLLAGVLGLERDR